jgi:predicted CXXCH cytochrome family protein
LWLWAIMLGLVAVVSGLREPAHADDASHFVGGQACAGCHAPEASRRIGSHHALAMQPATPATVLGDFTGARLEHFGSITTFSRAGDSFVVRTEGPDGTVGDYAVAYTFGVSPLQQYLIAMPGGRLQALGVAWDSRPAGQGGQRWFHLYPDQKLPSGDRLHWTGRDQTWNYMCADCHSTGLQKNFDPGADAYTTKWSDVNVSCEACHGPGSGHVAWARRQTRAPPGGASETTATDHMGLTTWLKPTDTGRWVMNAETGIARRTEALVSAELDTCAACHARRKVIVDAPQPGGNFLDRYLPALLEPGLYHADGQIDGEVFEYGSFMQSRMHRAGVTCSDCHEPHSSALRAEGNHLCAQCHMPATFDAATHHHHEPGSPGAQCINCHMPAKTFMVIDERHDHSFRVPRPDLSVANDAPDTCTQCHTGRSAPWAARVIAQWFPNGRQMQPHYGVALQAGRTGAPDQERILDTLIEDTGQPGIARASALLLMRRQSSPPSSAVLETAVRIADPLVRMAVPRALPASPSPRMARTVAPLLVDPVRAVRVEAARALAGADPQAMTAEQRNALGDAVQELVAAEMVDADRPEAHLNLGLLNIKRRQPTEAEVQYRTALRLDPTFVPALVNLADLDRMRGLDQQGADLLRKATSIEPRNADVRYALGLLLVRQHNGTEAVDQLRQAAELAPGNTSYAYVYAIALNSVGEPVHALAVLERAHQQHTTDTDILVALISIARDQGDITTALRSARELAAQYPGDPQIRTLIDQLEQRPAH